MVEAFLRFSTQVPVEQMHYRNKDAEGVGRLGHSMESKALVTTLAVLPGRRQFKADSKSKSLLLLKLLIEAALVGAGKDLLQDANIQADVFAVDNSRHPYNITFNEAGLTQGFESVGEVSDRAATGWQKLASSGWCGKQLTTSLESASLWDLLFFCAWAKGTGDFAWHDMCSCLYPKLVDFVATLLDKHSLHLAAGELKPVPILRTQAGNIRRIARGNKLLLFDRCRNQQRARADTLRTHKDLTGKQTRLVQYEAGIEVKLYMQKLFHAFQNTKQIQVSWDESHYDTSTMVLACFDWRSQAAGFLPIQEMQPVTLEELHDDIKQLCFLGKVTRIEGFATMRALSHALAAVGLPLEVFELPAGFHIHALAPNEFRFKSGGEVWVFDRVSQITERVVPAGIALNDLPCLISMSDQGPVNLPALDMLVYRNRLVLVALSDPFHRCWNDCKWALRHSYGSLWKTLLQYSLIFNLNYGPASTKKWFLKKQQLATDFMATHTCDSELFRAYLPFICKERHVEEATTREERELFFDSIAVMPTLAQLGPLTKLMRWFSFWECEAFYKGDVWMTKMLMSMTGPQEGLTDELLPPEVASGELSHKEELRKLKLSIGSWKLAPLLITPSSFMRCKVLTFVAKPLWDAFSSRAKNITTPAQVEADYVSKASSNSWAAEIHSLISHGFYNLGELYEYRCDELPGDESNEDSLVVSHFDMLTKLV